MLVKDVLRENALELIAVTVPGIIVVLQPAINVLLSVSIMALQLSRESYFGLPSSTWMDSILLQPPNAPLPIGVTDFGMNNEIKLLQP